jgi:CubicO group peptidase (beta-lactamase class C family)
MLVKRIPSFILILALSAGLSAEELPFANHVTTGLRYKAQVVYVKPSQPTRPLSADKTARPEAGALLDQLFVRNNSKSLIAAQNSKIIYERYSFGAGKSSTPIGYSMSKSLTALTVGRAICDGHISSINDPVERYLTELSGTSWGKATVRDLLRMSSGAYHTDINNSGHRTHELMISIGSAMRDGVMTQNFIDLMRANDQRVAASGEYFNYSNFDTTALGFLVERATGLTFSQYFERTIWRATGAERSGAWVVNSRGQTGTYMGFSATPHDWVRIGLMVLEELKNKDSCFGKFLNEATSRQIDSNSVANEYGYQIWVGCRSRETDFCFVGYGGQYLLFNTSTNTVVYQHATTTRPVVNLTPKIMDRLVPLLTTGPESKL